MSLLSILLRDTPTPTLVASPDLLCTPRHDDLKEMLDTNKDSLKLEAMKRIVAVSGKGVLRAGWVAGRNQRAALLVSLWTFP